MFNAIRLMNNTILLLFYLLPFMRSGINLYRLQYSVYNLVYIIRADQLNTRLTPTNTNYLKRPKCL